MEVLDATSLAERLKWEAKEYWLHLQAESPLEKYPAKQHARRVQEKLGVEYGLIYLPGQAARNNEDSDMPAPFRQLRYFYYLSGCNEPGCHLLYDIRTDRLSLFIPRIDPKRVIWNGRGSNPEEAHEKYDIDQVRYVDELEGFIEDWEHDSHNRVATVFILHELPPGFSGLDPRLDLVSLQPAMNIARMIKDDHEIKLIRRANEISSKAHREVLASILKLTNEAQVEGLFVDVCISHQAKQQAYDPIAASGPNAGTLHYDANNEDFADRQLMCLDAGCEFENYASDITRTFPLSATWPSQEAKNIYELVQRMQEACIKQLEPGVRYLDLHIRAHHIAIDGLLQLGIFHNGTREEIYKAGTSRAFFPHGLGHHVGLEVHDPGQAELMSIRRGKPVYEQAPSLYPENFHTPVYNPETCHAPTDPHSSHLEEGMVVTVEPGIYFSVYALQHFYLPSPVHSQYINAEVLLNYLPVGGVRIEDDILITSNGHENLTSAPKGNAMLDIIRSGKPDSFPVPIRRHTRRKSIEQQPPLLRAPGISGNIPEPISKPLARAATMPAEFKQRDSVDFEPFDGPSLFSNFKRSMTTDENVQHWQQSRERASAPINSNAAMNMPISVCGESTPIVQHTYMSSASSFATPIRVQAEGQRQRKCQKCMILVQTLDRLRQNLNLSTQNSPRLEQKPSFQPVARKTSFEKTHEKALTTRLLKGEETELKSVLPIEQHVSCEPLPIRKLHRRSTSPSPQHRSQAIGGNAFVPRPSVPSDSATDMPVSHPHPLHNHQSTRSVRNKRSDLLDNKVKPSAEKQHSTASMTLKPSPRPRERLSDTVFKIDSAHNYQSLGGESKSLSPEVRAILKSRRYSGGSREHAVTSRPSLPALRPSAQIQRQGKGIVAKGTPRLSKPLGDLRGHSSAEQPRLERRSYVGSLRRRQSDVSLKPCRSCGLSCSCGQVEQKRNSRGISERIR